MRTVYDIAKDIATYAPTGGATWQNVGMRQVPVRLLTELREAVQREQRVKVRWTANERLLEGTAPSEWWQGLEPETQNAAKDVCEFAGAWKFDG